MRSNYKKLGEFIRQVDERNSDLEITNLQGVSITKEFVPSIANIIGTDLSTYKIVRTGQFAYGPVTSRNGDKVSIALLKGEDCIISSSYFPFEVHRPDELLPEYLMLWFMRPEFDRYARFMSNGSAREVFDWDCMCDVELPVPPLPEQRKIVHDYQVITDRIELLRKINENIEENIQLLYSRLFIISADADNWESGVVGDVLQLQRGHDLPRTDMQGGDYPVAGSLGTIGFHNQYTTEAPAIVLGRSGNIGNPRIYLCRCWAHNTSLYVREFKNAEPIWAYYLLRNLNFEQFSGGGSAVPTLNRNDVHASVIKIPPYTVQHFFSKKALPLLIAEDKFNKEKKIIEDIRDMLLRNSMVCLAKS